MTDSELYERNKLVHISSISTAGRLGLAILFLALGLPHDNSSAESPQSHPNVLWITSEDNAAHWLKCYGDVQGFTPHLDTLAAESAVFTHAYSNSPVCAVARSTILRGAYATTTGTQHMRSRYEVSARFKPYVLYLRERGYYCSNNSKTDYNSQIADREIWDDSSREAHYKNRAEGQPFFAVFNIDTSHESSLFPDVVAKRRKQDIIPQTTRLDPNGLVLPPHVPDLPEVRSDFAIYYDNLTAMDDKVGSIFSELEKRDLSDDTIVFYYSDHGGPTPRSKRYLKDTGVRVPLLVRIPPNWQHLSPFLPGDKVEELVAFVDFAPTLLSLCGIDSPKQMQGRAFLGKGRIAPTENELVYLFGDRFDGITGMRRGITDGRYKYIRRFSPHRPAAPYSIYQLSMPSWWAWQKAWQSGLLPERHARIWESPQPVEELFDTATDPWEVNNLANDPAQRQRLHSMRNQLREKMLEVRDTSLVPESLFRLAVDDSTVFDFVQSGDFEFSRLLDLAFLASQRNPENLPSLLAACRDANPIARYWGALGCQILGRDAAEEGIDVVLNLTKDPTATVRMTAAGALHTMGFSSEARAAAISVTSERLNEPESIMLTNTLTEVDALGDVPEEWIANCLNSPEVSRYVKRFAQRLKESRQGE